MPDAHDLRHIAVQILALCGTPEDCDVVVAYFRDVLDRIANRDERSRAALLAIPPPIEPPPNA
jgi:hypothetical protein